MEINSPFSKKALAENGGYSTRHETDGRTTHSVQCVSQLRASSLRYAFHKKGQFFILGAVLIVSILLAGLPIAGKFLQPSVPVKFTENVVSEHSKAMNLLIREGMSAENLADFTRFVEGKLGETDILWLVSEPSAAGVKVTVGNFLDENENILLNVDGTEKTVFVNKGSTNFATFDGVSSEFLLTAKWDSRVKQLTWLKDKVNLFIAADFEIGKNLIRKEYVG